MMKNVDLGSIMNMAKEIPAMMAAKLPSFDAIKSVFGIPEDASTEDIKSMILERLNAAGVPCKYQMILNTGNTDQCRPRSVIHTDNLIGVCTVSLLS